MRRQSTLDAARAVVEARRLKKQQRRELSAKYYGSCPVPKSRTIASGKRQKKLDEWNRNRTTRDYVFGRERGRCRCCRVRHAQTMHELIFRSQRGKVSASNSVALCGDGVRGCHGFLQRHEIAWEGTPYGAEDALTFTPKTKLAAEWMRVALGLAITSLPGSRQSEVETES